MYSNLFQNMTLEKHFQYLYEATQSNLSQQQRNAEVVQMLQMLGFDNGEELLNYYPFELVGYGAKSCLHHVINKTTRVLSGGRTNECIR